MTKSELVLKANDRASFFKTPMECYPPNLGFVSQLKSDIYRFLSVENPLFRSEKDFYFWTAFRNSKPVGRILAHIHNASNEKFNLRQSYFGLFDCIDDTQVAQVLLQKAEEFGRSHGCNEITGNFNLTAMQQIGVITKIFKQEHYTDQVFAPVYISKLLENCGYESYFPMRTYEVDIQKLDTTILLGSKQKAILENSDYQFIDFKTRTDEALLEAIRHCLNTGFVDNPMFVPLTKEEVWFQSKDLMMVIDRHISSLIEYKGQPAGVIVCIPNLNPFLKAIGSKYGVTTPYHFLRHKLRRESATIIFYSVGKQFHSLGLNGAMLHKITGALKQRGYKRMGITWISLDNSASLRQVEKMGGLPMHETHLYRKPLSI